MDRITKHTPTNNVKKFLLGLFYTDLQSNKNTNGATSTTENCNLFAPHLIVDCLLENFV